MTNNNNKDAAADTNKPNEQPKAANSPRRIDPNNQDQDDVSTHQMPGGSRVEIGGSSLVPSPTKPVGTEVGESSSVPTTTVAAAATLIPPRNINIGGSGAIVDLNIAAGDSKEGIKKRLPKTEKRSGGQSSCMPVPKRARGEMDAPQREPICDICSRRFSSWKAVFGHMRAHPDREWRGAFPPPKGDWSPERPAERQENALQSQLAPALLNIARDTLNKMNQDPNPSKEVAGTSSQKRTHIDLNAEPKDSGASGSSSSSSDGFDLNKPPKKANNENEGSSI